MRRSPTLLLLTLALVAACDETETEEVVPEPSVAAEGETELRGAAGATAGDDAVEGEGDDAEPGPTVEDPTFLLTATASGPYSNGQLGQFAITLTPRGEYHVNQEYPIRVEIEGPDAVGLAKSELERADAAEFGEERARFDVPFTPSAAGEHPVRAKIEFAVCTEENCVPDERTLALNLPVE
jgi:hypothetical protein